MSNNLIMKHKDRKKYTLPKGITEVVPELILEHRDCECIIIPEGVTIIKDASFWEDTALQEIVLPDSLLEIGDAAFWGCTSLVKISLGSKLKRIGASAFGNCPLQGDIILPATLEELGIGAFASCKCNILSENESFVFENNALYNADKSSILYVRSDVADFTIPDHVKRIEVAAFSDCSNLKSIIIPSSIEEIGPAPFAGCKCDIVSNNCLFVYEAPFLFTEDKGTILYCRNDVESITIPDMVVRIGFGGISDCQKLASVRLSQSLKEIGPQAFWHCISLKEINLPPTVETIGEQAFARCSSLEGIIIPDNTKDLGPGLFWDCASIREVHLPNTLNKIEDELFWCCESLISVNIPDGVISIGEDAFWRCESLQSIIIPNTIESIGESAFEESGLINISIPQSVKFIGAKAFYGCFNLNQISLYEGIQEIQDRAFFGCQSLESIGLPNSLSKLGKAAFGGCYNLRTAVIGEGVKTLNTSFFNCNSLQDVSLPNTLERIEELSFHGCESLSSIIIPESVTSIGSKAFYGCSSLKEIAIPFSVSEMGSEAFYNCNQLKKVILNTDYNKIEVAFENSAVLYKSSDSKLKSIISSLSEVNQNSINDTNEEKKWDNLNDFFIEIQSDKSLIDSEKQSFADKQLLDKFWALCSKSGQKATLLFKPDGMLYFTKAGDIQEGTWERINNNNSIVLRSSGDTIVFENALSCNGLLVIKKTDTDNYLVLVEDDLLRLNSARPSIDFAIRHLQGILDIKEEKEYRTALRKQKSSLFWKKVGKVFQIFFFIYLIGGIIQNIVSSIFGYPSIYGAAISDLSTSWGYHDAGFFAGWLIFMGLYLYMALVVILPVGATWDLSIKGKTVTARFISALFLFTLLDCLVLHFFKISIPLKAIIVLVSIVISFIIRKNLKRETVFDYWWFWVIIMVSIIGFTY